MPVAVVGVAAYAGTVAAGYTVATAVAVGVVAAVSTQVLADSMVPEMGATQTNPVSDQSLTTQSNQPRKIVYGEALIGGQIVGYGMPTIGGKEYHVMVVHLVGHPCDSVELYEIEGKTAAELGSKLSISYHTGSQTTANSTALSYIDGWTSAHVGKGQTYAVVKVENDPNLFSGSINEMKFKVRGQRLYDPRKDDSAGGSGLHRIYDESTWEWSDNPMLCVYHALMTYGAKPVPQRRIPWDFVAVCANYCEEQAAYTDTNGNPATGQRFGCNGVLNNSVRPNEILNQIMMTMGAKLYRVGGRVFIKPAMYAGPPALTVDVSEAAERPYYQPHRPYRDLTNFVRPEYIEPDLKWQVTSAAIITSDAYKTADKAHLESTIRLNMVTKSHQAQRLGKLKMERSRAGFVASYPLPGIRLDIVPGTTLKFTDAQSGINAPFLVEDATYNIEKRRTELTLIEDGPQIYPDGFEPAVGELTPNTTLPDATLPKAPHSVTFQETPNDAWRQGVITFSHPSPSSIVLFLVQITDNAGYSVTLSTLTTELSLVNTPVGDYSVVVTAKNRFEKYATAAPVGITVNSTPTPSGVSVEVLTGRTIITGPPLPHDGATYEWKYNYSSDFASALDGGRNISLTITDTPEDGTVTIWYRLIDGMRADPEWTTFTVSGLLGLITITDNGNGSYTLSTETTSIIIKDGVDGDIPTVTDNGDGTYTITGSEGQQIHISDGAPGYSPIKGIDYFDGLDGNFVSSIFKNAATQPATPTGGSFDGSAETFPSGWTDSRTNPSEGQLRWISSVRYEDNGDGTWSRTSAWSEPSPDFQKGDTGPAPTVADNGNGSYTITGSNGSITIFDGNDGDVPTITDNGDGTYTIANTIGESIIVSDGADGSTPVKGIDYFDGLNGDYVSSIFINAASKPATPTGGSFNGTSETFPSGTTDNKTTPATGEIRWVSTVRYKDNGDGTWTRRTAWSSWSPDFEKGDKGDAPTVVDNGNGSYTITGSNGSITIYDGNAGDVPTITDNGDGTYTIANSLGESIVVSDGADGTTPVKGIDYFDGLSGDYVSSIFKNAATQPATPTGGSFNGTSETFPSGTTDNKTDPPAGQIRWVSTVRYKDDGDGTWSRRTAWSDWAPDFEKGDTGAAGQDGVAAPNITPTRGLVWQFKNDNNNGWVPYNANFSYGVDTFIIDATSSDPYIVRNSIGPFSGRDSYAIVVKLRCTTADLNTTASMYFMRSGDSGYDGTRVKNISARYKQDEYTYLVFDMRNVNAYISANITGLRFDPAGANQTFEIDQIWIGYTGAADETDYEDSRISNDALQAGTVLYYNDLRSASVSWSSGSQNSGGNAYSVSSGYAGDAFVHILSADSEGGHFISMNGIQNGNGLAGADNELRWYTRKVNVSAGTNTLRLYAGGADGGSFYAVVVTNTQIFDPEAFLSSRDAYLNNRIGAVRPDNAYKNSNTTPFDVGLENVDNVSQATILNNAYNQAITSVLLRNPDGTGINFVHPAYFNPLPEIPLGSAANLYGSLTAGNPRQFPGELPAGINRVFRLSPTTSDGYLYLGRSSTDYNLSIIPNRRWLVTAYTLRWNGTGSGLGVPHIQIYLKINNGSGSHRSTGNAVATGALREWRRQVIGVIDCTGDSATEAVLRVDCDSAPGSEMWVAGIMLEPVDTASNPTPSPYSAPLGTAPILSNGYLPMNTNAGQSTQSIQPLATSKYNNAARITINAHTLYVGDLSISYSTGHIDGLAYSTVYYIYCDDPYSQGGTPPGGYKYVDAASYQDLSKSSGRYWIGAKKTVSSGGTTPPPDDDFNCVAEDMYLVAGLQAKDCQTGDILDAWNPDCGFVKKAVKHRPTATAMCIAIRTESGAYTEVSFTTPIDLEDGRTIIAANAEGEKLLVLKEDGSFCWERVISAQLIGEKTVVKINCGDVSYASGIDVTNRIVTHNAVFKP